MTWKPQSDIIASDPYTCAVYAKKHDLLSTPGWKLLKRHARTARRLIGTLKKSKNRQPKHQDNTNMDGRFQETMHMLYNLIYKMSIINGRMLFSWKLNKSKKTKYSKYGKAAYDKDKIGNAPKGYQKIRVHFFLMSNTVEISRQDLW